MSVTAEDPPTPTFAAWFRDLLHRSDLSHDAAARELGVPYKTVQRWASGRTEPRLAGLRLIYRRFQELPPDFTSASARKGYFPQIPKTLALHVRTSTRKRGKRLAKAS